MVTNLPNTQHTIPKYGVVFIYVTGIWYISVFADVAGIDRSKLCDFFQKSTLIKKYAAAR
jgi:hypothetical protein